MRVSDLRLTSEDGTTRAAATVHWESRRKPAQDIYFAVPESSPLQVEASANAFLLACADAAAFHLEQRLLVEGSLCPRLVAGVQAVLEIHESWYHDSRRTRIEGAIANEPFQPAPGASAALAFSGGVDSLSILRSNRRLYPLESADALRHGIVITEGYDPLDIGPGTPYWAHLQRYADEVDLSLTPVVTNIRSLEPSDHFFGRRFFGGQLAATAHAVAPGIGRFHIASNGVVEPSRPEGSHPMTDHLFSSGNLEVIYDSSIPDRYDRTIDLLDWSLARESLKVCLFGNRLPTGTLNCGVCEKCTRTRLTLLAAGRANDVTSLDGPALTPEFLRSNLSLGTTSQPFYPRIEEELRRAGRPDLADVIAEKRAEAEAAERAPGELLRRFESKALRGVYRKSRKLLRNHSPRS